MLRLRPLAFILALLAGTAASQAQSVLNPHTVSFVASADHDATTARGDAVVSRYEIWFYEQGASDPFLFLNLDKPAPASGGVISVDFSALLPVAPRPGRVLEARVVAVGPGGWGVSEPSNSFMFGMCVTAVTPVTVTFPAEGGSATIAVAAGGSCAWDVSSTSWIAVNSGLVGRGSGAVTFTAIPNTTLADRRGEVVIGGLNVQVVQQAGWAPLPVFLRGPVDRATFTAPAQIDMSAVFGLPMSSAGRGSRRDTRSTRAVSAVVEVRFYANGTLVGTASGPPYTIRWRDVPAGNYALIAIARNSLGVQSVSRAVTVRVK